MLMVASMLAIGVAISALFSNQLVAFAVNLGVMLLIWLVQVFSPTGSTTGGLGNTVLTYINFIDHYIGFYRGAISISDIVYYLSMTSLALFLGSMFVESRRWR
jgi:ABC-2 type transport system permease protein